MKKVFILVSLLFLFSSCENSLYELLSRTTTDPFPDVPQADSFLTEETVYLTWQEDEGADAYVLKRASDATSPYFEEIYRGTNLSYVDSALASKQPYLYRLDKIRGTKYFKGEKTALGVSIELIRDKYEPNDKKVQATPFEKECSANLYAYEFADGRYLEDGDWYKISVPSDETVSIKINQTDLPSGAQTSFLVAQEGFGDTEPKQGDVFILTNTATETKFLYFKISPNLLELTSGTKTYTITVDGRGV